MKIFVAYFVTPNCDLHAHLFEASTASAAKKKAAQWASKATGWKSYSIVVETYTKTKHEALDNAYCETCATLTRFWNYRRLAYRYNMPHADNHAEKILEVMSIFMAQQKLLDSLPYTWRKVPN